MSTEWLKSYEIPSFSIQEQCNIAALLDKMVAMISLYKQQLLKLDELIKARFVEMFGDEKKLMAMSDVCLIITDGTHQPPKFKSEGTPFIFVSNIAGNKVIYSAEKYID